MRLGVTIANTDETDFFEICDQKTVVAGVPVAQLKFGNTDTFVALSGIGKENAAATAQVLISLFHVDALLNIGLAGGADKQALGSVVVITKAMYHDMYPMSALAEGYPNKTEFIPNARLIEIAKAVLNGLSIRSTEGILATGDQFIEDPAVKDNIVEKTHCSCIEMEGAAVGHIAEKNDVPFCLVKIVSDDAGDGAHDAFRNTVEDGKHISLSAAFIKKFAEKL